MADLNFLTTASRANFQSKKKKFHFCPVILYFGFFFFFLRTEWELKANERPKPTGCLDGELCFYPVYHVSAGAHSLPSPPAVSAVLSFPLLFLSASKYSFRLVFVPSANNFGGGGVGGLGWTFGSLSISVPLTRSVCACVRA